MPENRMQAELRELERELPIHQATLERVRKLIEKADQRFNEDADRRHWGRVLDNLELALDKAKARVLKCELDIKKLRERLASLTTTPGAAPAQEVMSEELARELAEMGIPNIELTPISVDGAERILSIPLEELSRMTLDEVAQLHDEVVTTEPAPPESSPTPQEPKATTLPGGAKTPVLPPKPKSPRITVHQPPPKREVTSRFHSPGSQGSSFTEQLRQSRLKEAVVKIRTDRLEALSLEEIDLVMEMYERLSAHVSDNATEGLGSVMDKISAHCTELRRRRAQLYAKRRH